MARSLSVVPTKLALGTEFRFQGTSFVYSAMIRVSRFPLIVSLLCPICWNFSIAQQPPNSPVLKSYVPTDSHSLVTPNDLTYELWQEFLIVKKANEGDPIAQHELGIRYISGKGFTADTAKAAYWIKKAADYGL